jgi:hypothetical protein
LGIGRLSPDSLFDEEEQLALDLAGEIAVEGEFSLVESAVVQTLEVISTVEHVLHRFYHI